MIQYIPSSAAESLSQALWGLSRPSHLRTSKDTQYLFPWIVDTRGQRWIVVDTECTINIHHDAVLNGVADILQPWINEGQLPADTNINLAALVEGLRGQKLTVYDAFPDLFKSMARTRDQMLAARLITEQVPPLPQL